MKLLLQANLVLRFLLELAAFAALGWAAFDLLDGGILGTAGAAAAVIVATTVWGTTVAPRAPIALPLPVRLVIEAMVFGAPVAGLVVIAHAPLAILLGVGAVANRALTLVRFKPASTTAWLPVVPPPAAEGSLTEDAPDRPGPTSS